MVLVQGKVSSKYPIEIEKTGKVKLESCMMRSGTIMYSNLLNLIMINYKMPCLVLKQAMLIWTKWHADFETTIPNRRLQLRPQVVALNILSQVHSILVCKICSSILKGCVTAFQSPSDASTSLPSNTNAPIWSMSIEIHAKCLLHYKPILLRIEQILSIYLEILRIWIRKLGIWIST